MNVDTMLTRLVTQSGTFKFRSGAFTQITNIGFDPDINGRILIGTMQAGIFSTCNNGKSWEKVSGTELIPEVSSFYFLGKNKTVASSYGRGLWKISLSSCPQRKFPPFNDIYQIDEPLIYYMGVMIPLRQIHNPDVCPRCGIFVIDKGEIGVIDLVKESNEIKGISMNSGQFKAFNLLGETISELPFQATRSSGKFDAGKDENLLALLNKGFKVKGVYLEGRLFKGLILSKSDIQKSQLPIQQEPKTTLHVEVLGRAGIASGNATIRIRGKGFDREQPIFILIDGKQVQTIDRKAEFDTKGLMILTLKFPFTPGGHSIVVEQKTALGKIREAASFIIPLNDEIKEGHR